MASSEQVSLKQRVAQSIEKCWDGYWVFMDGDREQAEALARAQLIYDLAGEIQYFHRTTDPMMRAAAGMLQIFGDGYMLVSADWPDGLSDDSLPTLDATRGFFEGSGLEEWCLNVLRDDIRTDVGGRPRVNTRDTTPALDDLLIDPELEELRGRESPESELFIEGNGIVAAELKEWLALYPRWLADLRSGDAEETLHRMKERRSLWVRHLLFVRDSLPLYYVHGASAGAIGGLAVIGEIVRSLLLAGTAPDATALIRLHLLPTDELDNAMRRFELDSWLATL